MSEKNFKILFFTAIIIIVVLAFTHDLFPKEYKTFLFFGVFVLFIFTFIMAWRFSMREIKLKDGRSFDQFIKDEGFENCDEKSVRKDYLENLEKILEYGVNEIIWTTKNKRKKDWYLMDVDYSSYNNSAAQGTVMMFPVSINSNFSISRVVGHLFWYRIFKWGKRKSKQMSPRENTEEKGLCVIEGDIEKNISDSIINEIEHVFKDNGNYDPIANGPLLFSVTVVDGVCFVMFGPRNGTEEKFRLAYKISEILS